MASTILTEARREAEKLRAELASIPTFQKLQKVQALIDLYETLETAPAASPVVPAKAAPARAGTKLAQVEDVVRAHMFSTGERMSSGQLLAVVTEAGIEMGGKVPSKTLSSMLSNSQRLSNVKGYGYGPVEWGNSPGPNARNYEAPADLLASAPRFAGEARTSPIESHVEASASHD